MTCNLEPEPQARPDPVTGVVLPVAVDRGLTAAEKQAVRDRLRLGGATGPDAFGCYRVHFPGGRVAEAAFPNLHGDGRCVSGALTAAEPFPDLIRLAFELAIAGNLLLMPDGVARPLAPTEGQRHRVLRRWVTVITVPTARHLWAMVAPPPPLRPELLPPRPDDALVARLAELAGTIDGAGPGLWEERLDEFNRLVGTNLSWLDFQGVYGGTGHATWVRQVLSEPYARPVPDITRDELLELIRRVSSGGWAEHETFFWVKLLEANLNPRISDLIFWPGEYFGDGDNSRQLSPEQILDIARGQTP